MSNGHKHIQHKYTREEHNFLQSYIPGHTYKEIVTAYNEKFDDNITISRVKGYMSNHKINNGLTGRFKKGNIPVNKGKKGFCPKGCEKSWFQKGHIPKNHRPVGSERISKDGYVEIKVEEPNKWRLKHRVIWEKENGAIPKDCAILFLDGNSQNLNINNMQLIRRAELARINQNHLISNNADITRTGITIAKLANISGKRKREVEGGKK